MNWLVENTAVDSREAAIDLGAEMLGRGLIFHVSHRHGFQDKRSRLYRCASMSEKGLKNYLGCLDGMKIQTC